MHSGTQTMQGYDPMTTALAPTAAADSARNLSAAPTPPGRPRMHARYFKGGVLVAKNDADYVLFGPGTTGNWEVTEIKGDWDPGQLAAASKFCPRL